jgi:plastocyanin
MLITNIVLAGLAQSLTASAATMTVTVAANNRFQFTPNTITAQPGDMVAFNFVSQNHSVASSDANSPCRPAQNAIFSDFQPVAAPAGNGKGRNRNNNRQITAGNTPTFMVPIVDDQPMYIYCSQAQHCQQGMVMVINPPNAAAVQQYANKAAKARNNVSPRGGMSGGTVLNNAAGTNPRNGVLGANAGDAATKGKGNKNSNANGAAGGLLAGVLGGKTKQTNGNARRGGAATAAGIVQGVADATGSAGAAKAAGILNGIAGTGAGAGAGASKSDAAAKSGLGTAALGGKAKTKAGAAAAQGKLRSKGFLG